MSASQIQQMGIQLAKAQPTQGAWQAFPGELVLPSSQQRVVAAPVSGLIEGMSVAIGETVKSGQGLVRLKSVQSGELQIGRAHV